MRKRERFTLIGEERMNKVGKNGMQLFIHAPIAVCMTFTIGIY